MRPAVTRLTLAFCLAAISAAPGISQTLSDEPISDATTPAPVAYVYVQTPAGINLYNAAASGQLTLVKGSPFKTSGLMIGSNGKYFITLGTTFIHSYAIGSNGAILSEVSTINTQSYPGGSCGTTNGARLEHLGQNVYVNLWNGLSHGGGCSALQSYLIAKGTGALSFISLGDDNDPDYLFVPTISSTDAFGYSIYVPDGEVDYPDFTGFKRAANGGLDPWSITVTQPVAQDGTGEYHPILADAVPGNYLVAGVERFFELDGGSPAQLASYRIDRNGNLISTNTWKNMPFPKVCLDTMDMSPAGNLLAVGGVGNTGCGTSGVQIFHFNGAAPITPYGKQISTAPIDQIRWDKSNHLFAVSHSTNKVYVYTVTLTKVAPVAGSPYTISGVSGIIVVPKV